MQVKEILRVKGNRLISAEPGSRAVDAVKTMTDQNLGSLVVIQFWTLANDVFHAREAKRLFGYIGGGGTLATLWLPIQEASA